MRKSDFRYFFLTLQECFALPEAVSCRFGSNPHVGSINVTGSENDPAEGSGRGDNYPDTGGDAGCGSADNTLAMIA